MRKGTGIFGKGYSKSVQRYQGARHCRTQDIEAERTKELLEEGIEDTQIIKKVLEEFPSFDSKGYTNKNGVYVESGEEKVKGFIQYWREKEAKSNEDDGR